MAVPFLPQARPVYPGNADLSNPLMRLGDSVAEAVTQTRSRNALQDFSASQDPNRLIASGDPRLAQMGIGLQQRQMDREADQANADRAFGLRERQFEQSQANADRAFGLQREQFEFSKQMSEAELGLKRLANEFQKQGGYKNLKERAEVEEGLRKEFTKMSDDFIKVRDAHRRVEASAKDPSAAGDLALIFNYMKVLDPGSTVREGEFANAQNAGGVPQRVQAMYNSVLNGQRLADSVRKDFVGRSGRLFESQKGQHDSLVKQFTGIGERLGVDIRNTVPDLGAAQTQAAPEAPPPPPGFTEVP